MSPENGVNILMVDDEPSNLVALEAILEGVGQNLVKASSGAEALRAVLTQDFAAILLDVQMPGLSGIETAALIREREQSRHIPIIFLTGMVKTDEMMFKGYSTGAVDYLMKPIVPEILKAKVRVFAELAAARKKLQEEIAERARVAAEISKLNKALEKKNADLVAANADLESFGYSVSHDLRAPLRHISGYVGLLDKSLGGKLNEVERGYMERIQNSVQRMGQLIEDLLHFSRIAQSEMSKTLVSMDQMVQETVAEMQPDLANRNIVWDIQPLPSIHGDPGLLRQVWANLIGNAVKYSRPRDPARIQITADTQGDEFVFQIKDNGVGFKMAQADRLFGLFKRLHLDTQFEGTGIGLANVRRIVQMHGGRTWGESREGEGATFYFSLPVKELD